MKVSYQNYRQQKQSSKKDIVVQKVPYFETSNNYDGVTVYIAEEVNQNA